MHLTDEICDQYFVMVNTLDMDLVDHGDHYSSRTVLYIYIGLYLLDSDRSVYNTISCPISPKEIKHLEDREGLKPEHNPDKVMRGSHLQSP